MKNETMTTIYNSITPQETKKLITKESDLVIIDVRTEKEFLYEGRLDGAILIDFEKPRIFKREIKKLDRKKTYLIYCAVGHISKEACIEMTDLGFENIFEMKGGLKSWQQDLDLICTISKLNDEEIIEARKSIITRLNKIEGQVKGMKKMLLNGEYCGDILNQSLAVKSALNSTNQEIMEMFSNVCITSEEHKKDFFKYLKKLMG
ncbi:metal-sensing transcriptional repressor [Psychrilyobacter atlanticus]|uniref:metal-sensing transcriptional repressor n=1 Tax=Psychrilyobacter atlanticus TaxID=271091 RepID=UPI00041E8872|nr:metal-sensing transcriptional repressor [Psychrilyobacter atlanticus]